MTRHHPKHPEKTEADHNAVNSVIWALIIVLAVLFVAVMVFDRHMRHRAVVQPSVIIANGPIEKDTSKPGEKIDTAPAADPTPAVAPDPIPPEAPAVVVEVAPELPAVAPEVPPVAPVPDPVADEPVSTLPDVIVTGHPVRHRHHVNFSRLNRGRENQHDEEGPLVWFFEQTARLAGVLR